MFNDNNFLSGGAADFYDHPIEQSLRFNDDDSAYLSWTPASAGNRRTWTWSGWVKRGNKNEGEAFFSAYTNNENRLYFFFDADSKLGFYGRISNSVVINTRTSAVFRDHSAWYHVVAVLDTTQSTAADRVKLYVNGQEYTLDQVVNPSQNLELEINKATPHYLGSRNGVDSFKDGYLAEVHFIDGAALDASSFGETKSGVWIPKAYSGSYGTNGFYLPFNHDYSVEGFSATTYTGNNAEQYIGGVGFSPDLVWIKERSGGASISDHALFDSVRGTGNMLSSNTTGAEQSNSVLLSSFESDGFTLGNNNTTNQAGYQNVAWCWDAGSGSPVSNTDGSITSSVKASTDYGFSIVSWTGNATTGATVGHGLSQQPDLVIIKNRDATTDWDVHVDADGDNTDNIRLQLNTTDDDFANARCGLSATTLTLQNSVRMNGSGNDMIAYCFHSVSGYSKIGSYTGTGASGNSVTTGFKPAFVMMKRTDASGYNWVIVDNVRDATDPRTSQLSANLSNAENTLYADLDFDATGFTIDTTDGAYNASGGSYIYMAFADKREAAFWLDQSGNNNDFENNNLTESDISLDSPTNNFCTWNPLALGADGTLSEGNLRTDYGSSATRSTTTATFGVSSGKWYWEVVANINGGEALGVTNESNHSGYFPGSNTGAWGYYSDNGTKWIEGSSSSYGASWTTGDVIGFALDMDAGTLVAYKNGVSQGTMVTGLTDTIFPAIGDASSAATATNTTNFGQDSSFAGNKTAQGNTDDNGYGDFYYAPPTGYLALCTANLEVPDAMNPALDNSPQDYFNTVLYTGNGSTQSITGVGFQPDFTWIKERNRALAGHAIFDVIRTPTIFLQSNTTGAEVTNTGTLTSFDSDGFSLGASTLVNTSAINHAAWNWKANGSGVSNTDGSITSTVSANTDAGFSIVSYTGNGSTNQTVGHGLGVKPKLKITKSRSFVEQWVVTGELLGGTDYRMFLNLTNANGTAAGYYPADTTTTLGISGSNVSNGHNQSGQTYVSYVFADVEGFSKFGSYTGNGSADGPFVYTGFRPAFVMYKEASGTDAGSASWVIWDSQRNSYNAIDNYLLANSSTAEGTFTGLDLLSNGFKVRNNEGSNNGSGDTYIYMAFAETPFKYSVGR